jgi:hypothetical protein
MMMICINNNSFADIDYFIGSPWVDWQQDKVPLFEHLLPDMDAWAMQLYRGIVFVSICHCWCEHMNMELLMMNNDDKQVNHLVVISVILQPKAKKH